MFWKKKQTFITQVDDKRRIVWDFRRRPIYESYRATDYVIHGKLEAKPMYALLNSLLDRLLPAADAGNQNMLNNQLLSIGLQSLLHLDQQRINHRDTIHRLTARRAADYYDIRQMLEDEIKRLDELMEAHQKTCQMLDTYEKGDTSNE